MHTVDDGYDTDELLSSNLDEVKREKAAAIKSAEQARKHKIDEERTKNLQETLQKRFALLPWWLRPSSRTSHK
jgi:hypothetical protein